MSDLLHTPLFTEHQALNARIVDFGGWALPVNYGSQVDEHHAVRKDCGMFDVSHMTVSDVLGPDTLAFMSHLLANDIAKAATIAGKALYSCMLNNDGGVIDDLIVYRLSDQHCRLVTNASTNEKDMAWIATHAQAFDVDFREQPQLALLAVQGPNALTICQQVLETEQAAVLADLKRFQGVWLDADQADFVGRTGYTGEDGVEFIIGAERAVSLWQQLLEAGVQPCGLGARDTLRLESGMSLYGNDLDEEHTPLESGLVWSVANKDEREFVGKTALAQPARFRMIGLVLEDRGVLRGHQAVMLGDAQIGETTSGTFSPTLEKSIALARINHNAKVSVGDQLDIAVRNKTLRARVVAYPFVKNGQSAI